MHAIHDVRVQYGHSYAIESLPHVQAITRLWCSHFASDCNTRSFLCLYDSIIHLLDRLRCAHMFSFIDEAFCDHAGPRFP
jgi:hypothetical protein